MSPRTFRHRHGTTLAAVLSLAVLVPGSFRMALAQPPAAPPPSSGPVVPTSAPAPILRRTPRTNPLSEALKSLDLTADQKSKIKEIRASARKDMDGISDRRSPEGVAKLREINTKIAADVKASLPVDLQTKFQTAYDAALVKSAEQAKAQGAAASLADFKRPLETLRLTPDTQAKVEPIVSAAYDRIVAARQAPTLKGKARTEKVETIVTEMKSQVRPLLTPEQQTKFDALDLAPKPARRRRPGAQSAPVAPAEGTPIPPPVVPPAP